MSTSQEVPEPLLLQTIWRAKGYKFQKRINELLGNRYFDSFPKHFLREKIEFGLFGPPPENGSQLTSENVKITDKLVDHIALLFNKIRPSCSGTICLEYTFIFLLYKNNQIGVEVLFRIQTEYNSIKCMFVDSTCRTYRDWVDYLENNQLPKCDMCFPNDGIYSLQGDFSVGYCKSPACKIGKSIAKGMDVTSTLVGLTATGISLAALAVPIAGPLVVAATATAVGCGAYDVTRGATKLVDRKQHKQSIGLDDSQSRKIWLDVTSSALSAVSVGGRALIKGRSAIKIGQFVIETETMAARFFKFSSIVANGVGILNMCITYINKFRKGEFDLIDIKQIKSSFLFFFNVLLSKDATIFLIGKLASLADSRSTDERLSFSSRYTSFTLVRNLTEFDRPIATSGSLLGMVRYSMKWVFDVNVSELDTLINGIISTAYKTARGSMSVPEGIAELNVAYKRLWRLFQLQIKEAVLKVRELFTSNSRDRSALEKYPESSRKLCLLSLDVIEHCQVEDPRDYFTKQIFSLVLNLIRNNQSEFSAVMLSKAANSVCYKLKELFDSEILGYNTALEIAKQRYRDKFDFSKFLLGLKIPDNVDINCYFLQMVIIRFYEFNTREKSQILNQAPNSNAVSPCLETDSSKHFLFEGPPGQVTLTDNQYWQMAIDLSGFNFNIDTATLYRYENYVYIALTNEHQEKELYFFNTTFYHPTDGDIVAGIFSVINTEGAM